MPLYFNDRTLTHKKLLLFLQGMQTLSVSTTPSKCGSGGSQSMLSSNSCSTKEAVYATVGLYQVQILNHMLENNALHVKPKYFN